MINSMKTRDINSAIKRIYNEDSLIQQLFEDFPSLNSIHYSKTQEYNDNDYSTYFRVIAINGNGLSDDAQHGGNGEYDVEYDRDDEEKGQKYNIAELNHILSCISHSEEFFDDTDEDGYIFLRESLPFKGRDIDNIFKSYYVASLTGKKIEDLSVFSKDTACANWALYYCVDLNDKLPEDSLINIFQDNPEFAYLYAKHVLKGKLPQKLEDNLKAIANRINLKSFEKEDLNYREAEDIYYINEYFKMQNV